MVIAFDPFSFGLGALQFGVSMYGQSKAKRREKRAARKEQAFNNRELARMALGAGRQAEDANRQAQLLLGAAGVRGGSAATAATTAAISAESIRAQEEFTRQIDHSRQKGGFAHSGFLGGASARQKGMEDRAKRKALWAAVKRKGRSNEGIMKR